MNDPVASAIDYATLAADASNFDRGGLDILDFQGENNGTMIYKDLSPELKLVSESLEHITLNPKNEYKTFMLARGYVYPGENPFAPDHHYVNSNAASVRQFVRRLIGAANTEWYAADNPSAVSTNRRDRVTILTGEKGSGKTYFLNHMYSAFSGAFDVIAQGVF